MLSPQQTARDSDPAPRAYQEALLGIKAAVSLFPVACHVLAIVLLARLHMNQTDHERIRIHALAPVTALGKEGLQ